VAAPARVFATLQDLAGVFGIELSDLFVDDACRVWASCAAAPPGVGLAPRLVPPCDEIVAVLFVLGRPGG
jgi:hypothetical protein